MVPYYFKVPSSFGPKIYEYNHKFMLHKFTCNIAVLYCTQVNFYFRVILDRGFSPWDDGLRQVDLSGSGSYSGTVGDYFTYIRERKM